MSKNTTIIVGAGLAGLYCALNLLPQKSVIIALDAIGTEGSSEKAQGGIAAAIGKDDSAKLHLEDTLKAGNQIVDEGAADFLTKAAKAQIEQLIEFGVEFDKKPDGSFLLNQEAAHSRRRVVRSKGDFSGRELMDKLSKAVRLEPNITLLEHHQLLDFLANKNEVLLRDIKAKTQVKLNCKRLILATGGVGGLYQNSTNPIKMRGDGLAIAYKMGAKLANLEFVQFHPTAFKTKQSPTPLLTEAIRGDGGKLINDKGHYFMSEYHAKAELAPRDIVSRAVFDQIKSGNHVFLDVKQAIGSDFPNRFPQSFDICQKYDIDPSNDLIPITPAQHYHMGGIKVDQHGQSTVKGLFACGEVAYTGVHGANRLASNSLIEALVYANSISQYIKQNEDCSTLVHQNVKPLRQQSYIFDENPKSDQMLEKLREIMQLNVGLIRDQNGLDAALKMVETWQNEFDGIYPICNHLLAAKLIIQAALLRRESRGSHYRSDYKTSNSALQKPSESQLNLAEV